MKKFEITEDLAQATLNYLATRPYQEVFTIVPHFQNLTPIENLGEAENENPETNRAN